MEFAALQAAQAALPEVAESELEVSDASVMRLQSHVLNLLYGAPRAREDADAVRQALRSLAGRRLQAAAQAKRSREFPRGDLLSVGSDGSHNYAMDPVKVLAWIRDQNVKAREDGK